MSKKSKIAACAESIPLGGTTSYPTTNVVPPKGNASAQAAILDCIFLPYPLHRAEFY